MTSRDEALLLTLLYKVRWLTLDQIGELLGVESRVAIRRLVAALEECALLRRVDVFLPSPEFLRTPLARWERGAPAPPLR